jgi:hypothetical protein
MPSTPVTGIFWQATQPVSGTVTVGNASLAVTGTFYQATQPVSGTFWQATQPVSGTFWQATQPVSVAATVAVSGPVTDVQLRATAVSVVGPALTKATQGSTGFSVQDLKDAGRVSFAAATVVGGVTCVTTEALLTMVPVRDGTAAGTATTIAVTSGKRLRIQSITVGHRSSSAAVLSARFTVRINSNGAAAANGPILAILSTTQQAAALAEAGDSQTLTFPDGLEISGTQQIGITQVCSATTGVVYVSIIGYEY